jgi:hypothetical protein
MRRLLGRARVRAFNSFASAAPSRWVVSMFDEMVSDIHSQEVVLPLLYSKPYLPSFKSFVLFCEKLLDADRRWDKYVSPLLN